MNSVRDLSGDVDNGEAEVLIAIATANRPEELGRLLDALSQEYAARKTVSLLVVDNNANGSSSDVVREAASAFEKRVTYVLEPERGSRTYERVLKNVGDADWVVFIDDDEVPCQGWLDELVHACEAHNADVVAGPVVSLFPRDAPEWFEASRVFEMESPDFAEGAEMPWCATNNTVMRRHVIDLVPGGFDPKFNRMSGEDTDFFLRARLAGCKIVWTRRATVCEYLQPERLRRSWVFRRAIRSGNSRALIELSVTGSPMIAAKRLVKGFGSLGCGVLECTAGALGRDKATSLRGMHRVGLGYGMLRAFVVSEPWAP